MSQFAVRSHSVTSNVFLPFVLAAMLSPGLLWAAPEDTVRPYVVESITHDDNFLRLSKDVDPLLVSGQSSESETIKQSTAGVKLDWKQGRQNVIVDASISESRFSRFKSLDYQGKNFLSQWNWQLGNELSGDLGYTSSTVLGSFTEQQHLVNNLSTQERRFFDAAWQVQPSIRLSGTLARSTYSVDNNSATGNEVMDYEAGVYYTPASGNEVGIRGTHQVGTYPVKQLFFGIPVDNGYTQDMLLATVNWLYSGHIRLNGQAGGVSRTHNQFSSRDFSGKTMRGTLTWLATGKSQVNLAAWDEIDSNDDLTTSFTQSKGLSLGASWSPTSKIGVSAHLKHSTRDFLGDPGLLLFPHPVRHDVVNSADLSVGYQPIRTANISASIQTERRNSNQALVDYADNSVNLSMSFEF